MLELLRKASRTWFAKGLLLLLVASFGIWGVSSSLIGDNSDAVITVGDQTISTNEFRLAYQRQMSDLSRRFGTQLTTEQARALGIDTQVYAQLAAGAALDQLSDEMRLGLSEDRLAGLIAEDPAFRNESTGQFDRQLFASRLRNSGLREEDYILERSKVAVRSQIVEATSDGFTPPQVLVDALRQYRDESRTIDYLLLSSANVDPIKAPDDATLAAWFETVKARYRAPEYRAFSYVKLQPADLADPASVSDEMARQDYEARKARYEIAGTRTIEQLTFETREMAEAAVVAMKEGASFDQLVTDQGKTATDVLIGDFTKDRVPDPALAEAAFAIEKEGATSPVIDGSFGPVVLRVSNIKPGRTQSFDEVKEQIRESLATAAAIEDITTAHDRFEDLRASGSSLEDAAKELNLKPVIIDAIDRQGRDKSEKDIAGIPEKQALIGEVFQTDIGVEALPLSIGNDGYVWFEVRDIVAERDRPLAEVREKAVADWTAEQQKIELGAKVESLKERAEQGAPLADIAAELAISVENKTGLRRSSDDPVLGAAAVAAAFTGPVGTLGSAPGNDPDTQILLKVTEINNQPTVNALDNQDQQVIATAKAAGDDILDQMVNELQANYGVSVNQALAEQAMVR
ncbi:peptidylprolyl isomerase [Rhizobium sp. CG5]|uniref:peptidylprolyl isomerase n=1 Tax=Rhizobium sp. CG5 TaxID=2726076 RepID=UPI002033B52A|nr:peptidylprolyl isomerase [Rhizobium sp. CG5]MCM2474828.1 peptidylprolyl isomerase [Rhizobium sp. CG5]